MFKNFVADKVNTVKEQMKIRKVKKALKNGDTTLNIAMKNNLSTEEVLRIESTIKKSEENRMKHFRL